MSRPRLGLSFGDWPDAWRARWQSAITPAIDPLTPDGAGAHWAPDTCREIRKRLEQFFGFLHRTCGLDAERMPGSYLTETYLRPYLAELENRVASVTCAGYFRDLKVGIKAIHPEAEFGIISLVTRRLEQRARPSRDKRAQCVAPHRLYDAGIARMDRVEIALFEKEDVRAVQYGDGLAMAIAACSLDRRRNLVGIRISENLRIVNGQYRLMFSGAETKNRKPHACDLPKALTSYIDHYIARHRANLLGNNQSDALFISSYRKPMASQSFYCRFVSATQQELGIAMPPHRVRDSAVTALAEEHPDAFGIAPTLLHHQQLQTTRDHYNQATQIDASRHYNETLVTRRMEAVRESRKGKLFQRKQERQDE